MVEWEYESLLCSLQQKFTSSRKKKKKAKKRTKEKTQMFLTTHNSLFWEFSTSASRLSVRAFLLFNAQKEVGHDVHVVHQVTHMEIVVLHTSIIQNVALSALILSIPPSLSLFGSSLLQLAFAEGQSEGPKAGLDSKELVFLVQITCQVKLL